MFFKLISPNFFNAPNVSSENLSYDERPGSFREPHLRDEVGVVHRPLHPLQFLDEGVQQGACPLLPPRTVRADLRPSRGRGASLIYHKMIRTVRTAISMKISRSWWTSSVDRDAAPLAWHGCLDQREIIGKLFVQTTVGKKQAKFRWLLLKILFLIFKLWIWKHVLFK